MIRPILKLYPSLSIIAAILAMPVSRTYAQNPSSVPLPPDVQKTLSQVADLDLLVAITPLKLTPEQLDKMSAALTSLAVSDADVKKQDMDSLRSIAADVEKARSDALQGTPPDADTKTKINKALAEMDARSAATHTAAVDKVVGVEKELLTPTQVRAVESQYAVWSGGKITVPAEMRDDKNKQNAYIEDIALKAYTERILLVQRAIDIFTALKAAPPSKPRTAGDATTTPPAAAAQPAPQ